MDSSLMRTGKGGSMASGIDPEWIEPSPFRRQAKTMRDRNVLD
jgi:hypothetical protein